MIRMFTTTYGESVNSTPSSAMCEPSGPIENGITYMVRPRMLPSNKPLRVSRISDGSCQLLVGPASCSRSEQMKVRSSTRATSEGSERARKEFGRISGFSRVKVPPSTMAWVSRSHSASEPSHHSTRSGLVSAATSSTHSSNFLLRVGGFSSPAMVICALRLRAIEGERRGFRRRCGCAMPSTTMPCRCSSGTVGVRRCHGDLTCFGRRSDRCGNRLVSA